jgi:hypothetical protein
MRLDLNALRDERMANAVTIGYVLEICPDSPICLLCPL